MPADSGGSSSIFSDKQVDSITSGSHPLEQPRRSTVSLSPIKHEKTFSRRITQFTHRDVLNGEGTLYKPLEAFKITQVQLPSTATDQDSVSLIGVLQPDTADTSPVGSHCGHIISISTRQGTEPHIRIHKVSGRPDDIGYACMHTAAFTSLLDDIAGVRQRSRASMRERS